ncbi:methylmalonyl-CoA epimerase [Fodinibius saliphilus]|uniref:methylmalonyl-CoA epimerase n=1 Tax=Fodinibius saliphilus TaxID=1920650 RepID=UPI001108508D|nr:methylmalonyl-CoA epimerase [Fodinibius saliphilus]
MHIDHIGIAVEDLESAVKTYEKLLDGKCYKREVVEDQNVETAFFKTGQSKVELLGATTADSVIAKYIAQKGQGMHHVAFEVEDIYAELDRLREEGFTVLGEKPSRGADNKLVAFVHPKDNCGVLVELCQEQEG